MHIRKLYRTIENFATQPIEDVEELLKSVIHNIILSEDIEIKGGRLWKFNPKEYSYTLIHQEGEIEKIRKNYQIKVKEYPLFLELTKSRTIIADEINKYLRKKGIKKFTATGIGEKITVHGKKLYKYVLTFNSEDLSQNLIDTLNIISIALTNVLKSRKIEQKAKQLQKDLDKASEIQRSILPDQKLFFHNFEIFGISEPDQVVGGDFFDYLQSNDGDERIGIVIGDAASKGLSAAAQALYVSGAIRMGFEFQVKINLLISRINNLLNRVFHESNFVTLFYCELTNDKNGLVIYTNAGHNNPILYRNKIDDFESLETTGQILGPFPNEKYLTESTFLQKGDILALYTDGLIEARNEENAMFGENRLRELIRNNRQKSAEEIANIIMDNIHNFEKPNSLSDDKTLVIIKRN